MESLYWICRPLSSLPPSIYPFFLPFLSFFLFFFMTIIYLCIEFLLCAGHDTKGLASSHFIKTIQHTHTPLSLVLCASLVTTLSLSFSYLHSLCTVYFIALNFPSFVSFGLFFLMSSLIRGLVTACCFPIKVVSVCCGYSHIGDVTVIYVRNLKVLFTWYVQWSENSLLNPDVSAFLGTCSKVSAVFLSYWHHFKVYSSWRMPASYPIIWNACDIFKNKIKHSLSP